MTKEQWAELINLKLAGGDAPAQIQGQYSIQEIELYLTMAFNDVLASAWKESPSLVDDFVRSKKIALQTDTTRDERYVVIPSGVLPLPSNQGIIQIRQPKNPNMAFALIDINALPILSELEVGVIDNRVGYYAEGTKVYFDEHLPSIVEELLVKWITPFEGLGDEDEVSVPGGNNQVVFDTVYKLMLKTQAPVNQDNMVRKNV